MRGHERVRFVFVRALAGRAPLAPGRAALAPGGRSTLGRGPTGRKRKAACRSIDAIYVEVSDDKLALSFRKNGKKSQPKEDWMLSVQQQ